MDGRVALVATDNDAHGRVALVATGNDTHGRVALVATEIPADAAATSAALPSLPQRRHPSRNSVMTYHDNRSILLYVTVVTEKRNAILADKVAHDCIVAAWKAVTDWRVGRYVIMPDHIHFFCAPATYPPPDFHRWMTRWKAQVSRTFPLGLRVGACDCPSAHGRVALVATGNDTHGRVALVATEIPADAAATSAALPNTALPRLRLPPLFQRDCWDWQLRTGESYVQKWEYVRNNPVRKGLVAHADDWPYQGQMNGLEWHERT